MTQEAAKAVTSTAAITVKAASLVRDHRSPMGARSQQSRPQFTSSEESEPQELEAVKADSKSDHARRRPKAVGPDPHPRSNNREARLRGDSVRC